jgi:hypothetical protein
MMKAKIGDTVHDGAKEPVMVVLSKADKFNIAHMDVKARMYAEFPGNSKLTDAEKLRWMKEKR